MARNSRLTTQSYLMSRLRDMGYVVDRVYQKFALHDPRSWMVVIDPGQASVFITCLKNVDGPGDHQFEIYDCNQFTPARFKVNTNSIEVIVKYLTKFGIINKTAEYNEGGPKRLREAKAAAAQTEQQDLE